MSNMTKKNLDQPDERREPDKTQMDVVHLGSVTAARLTAQPGWRWATCIKPVVGTDSCRTRHVGAVVGGQLHVVHDDGTELDLLPGDAYVIESGHDAWVVGDEPYVAFEFESATAAEYARPRAEGAGSIGEPRALDAPGGEPGCEREPRGTDGPGQRARRPAPVRAVPARPGPSRTLWRKVRDSNPW